MLIVSGVVLVREDGNPASGSLVIVNQDKTVIFSNSVLSPVNDRVSNINLGKRKLIVIYGMRWVFKRLYAGALFSTTLYYSSRHYREWLEGDESSLL